MFLFQLKLYASWSDANPRIDNTYRGDAYNLDTLDRDFYTDVNFLNVKHPMLLYWFQFLFPSLTAILIVVYVICSRPKDIFKNINTISTTAAHALLSFVFIIGVFVIDIVAVAVRNETPEYYSDMYNKPLFDYPGVLLFWDILAIGIFVISALVSVWHIYRNENAFLLRILFKVPLLCFASHAHYILIAWITDPFYATSIGIYYGVCYIIHLLLFKRIYKQVDYLANNCNCKVLCSFGAATGVFIIAFLYQALITVFIVFLPINNAIEDIPSRLFIAIQSAGALLLGYLAYQAILGKESLSVIIGAVRKMIKVQPTFYTESTEWKKLENKEKLAKVLQHVFKTNVGSDGTNSPTIHGTTTSPTSTSPSTSTTPV